MTDLVVVLESLGEVVLNVKGSRQLVATLGPHGFVLGVVECVQGQVLDLGVVLLKEEVVGKVVEDHRVGGVDGVSLGQLPDALLDGDGFLGVEVEDGLADDGPDTVRVQLLRTLERHAGLGFVAQFVVACNIMKMVSLRHF